MQRKTLISLHPFIFAINFTMYKEKLNGVFVPVVSPFNNDDLRLDWLGENLDKLNQSRLKGYLALGSNGEFMSLSEREQLEVLQTFAKHKGNKVVMAGTARESTRETIEFSKKAVDTGVDFVSILTPHYFAKRTTDDVLIRYYAEIADKVSTSVLIYNAPGFAGGVQISPTAVKQLAEHPNIVGMKDSSPAGMSGFLNETKDNETFHILAGSANFFFPALVSGAVGGVLSLANCLPDLCCQLQDAFDRGEIEKARELHFKLFNLNKGVSGRAGVAAVKAAMDVMSYKGGSPRRPFVALDETGREAIRKLFEAEGVL